MQTLFYVANSGKQLGPFPIEVVIKMIKSSELEPTDYIYLEDKQDWVMMVDVPDIQIQINDQFAKAKEAPGVSSRQETKGSKDVEWFVLKGENRFGPFSYSDIITKLQDKSLYEYDFVWNPGMEGWKRVAETDDFAPVKVREYREKVNDTSTSEIFFRRRHARVSYGGSVVVHDNKRTYRATSVEISAGGASLLIENGLIQPGFILFLHFKPGDGVPPFNASCEVVSKQFIDLAEKPGSPIKYGVKFTSISQATVQSIKEFTKKMVA